MNKKAQTRQSGAMMLAGALIGAAAAGGAGVVVGSIVGYLIEKGMRR